MAIVRRPWIVVDVVAVVVVRLGVLVEEDERMSLTKDSACLAVAL